MINYSIPLLISGLGILTANAYYASLDEDSKIYAAMMSIIFWAVVAYIYMIERSREYQLQVIIAIMAIYIATLYYDAPNAHAAYKGLYVAGWLYFGYLTGLINGQVNKEKMALGMTAAVLMISSNFVFLPLQNKSCRVEGPGMAFKGVAWALLAYTVL